jgi:hypothetical protein
MYDLFINAVYQFGQYIILLGIIVSMAGIFYLIIDKRYPKVSFDVIEGKRKITITKRLMNGKIVNGDLISVLMNGSKEIGMTIDNFDYYFVDSGRGSKRRYIATRRGQDLIPIKFNEFEIQIEELGTAREIAMRYINAIDSVDKNMDKQNPIILAIIGVVPIAVILLITGGMTFLILNDALPKLLEVQTILSADNLKMANINAEITQNLVEISKNFGNDYTQTNQTYYIQTSGIEGGGN